MNIIAVDDSNVQVWAALCNELWPHNPAGEMLEAYQSGELPNEFLVQLDSAFIGFLSLSLRRDYVEGKEDDNPVGYIEGLYIQAAYRRRGIARALIAFAKEWSAVRGCTMLASDCDLANEASRAFHNRAGFAEAGINVHFKMDINN